MSGPTPDQMRVLAKEQERTSLTDRNAVRAGLARESAAALRAAADQLEAIQKASADETFETFGGEEVAEADAQLADAYRSGWSAGHAAPHVPGVTGDCQPLSSCWKADAL